MRSGFLFFDLPFQIFRQSCFLRPIGVSPILNNSNFLYFNFRNAIDVPNQVGIYQAVRIKSNAAQVDLNARSPLRSYNLSVLWGEWLYGAVEWLRIDLPLGDIENGLCTVCRRAQGQIS